VQNLCQRARGSDDCRRRAMDRSPWLSSYAGHGTRKNCSSKNTADRVL
jgi:hypothetical protein